MADPVQRARSALARLDAVDARTGCVADRDDAAVLAAAAAVAEGPLCGEPVTVKDRLDVAGFRCSGAEVEHEHRRPERDATAVARLRSAGAVVVAKTAVHVRSERFGVVRHPRDPRRSPGGSSSGDAAAVAGGAVRLGVGSDSGGSVRVPAAWCGVVGMKPSAGLVPVTGHFPRVGDRSDGRTVVGPLAESVALTVSVGSPGGFAVDDSVAAALDRARRVLRDVGARSAGPPPDWLAEARRVTEAYWDRADRTGAQVVQDLVDWDRFRRDVLRATRDVDVVVTPTVAQRAPLHRDMRTEDYLFCLPASLTGAPAVSVPVGDGAVQVIARRWCDHVAVAVARLLESAGA